jgi:hypothetical protein
MKGGLHVLQLVAEVQEEQAVGHIVQLLLVELR